MAGSVATELSRVATEILRGSVMRRPTVQIPAGTRFNVFLNGDLALAPFAPADGFMNSPGAVPSRTALGYPWGGSGKLAETTLGSRGFR